MQWKKAVKPFNALVAGALLFLATTSAGQPIDTRDIPAPARETIQRKTRGKRIVGVKREQVNGRIFYEVEFALGAKTKKLNVTPDGAVLIPER